MAIYIAMLRGINVGGKNLVKMADLKRMFIDLKLNHVQTFIQSGNVLFESAEEEEPLRKIIEQQNAAQLGFLVTVVLRTAAELAQLTRNCPFSKEAILQSELSSGVECLYVSLLAQSPRPEAFQSLDAFKSEEDECRLMGRDIYLLLPHGIRNSKLTNNLQRLGVAFTIRNWKTLTKLDNLARAIKD